MISKPWAPQISSSGIPCTMYLPNLTSPSSSSFLFFFYNHPNLMSAMYMPWVEGP